MALFHRFVSLNHKSNIQVFTFILPKTIIRDFPPEVMSRDFMYGYQKWFISFIKTDKHLGATLSLRNTSDGMRCYVDYSFILLNRDHFSRNEIFSDKECEYTPDNPTHGSKNFVSLPELLTRQFTDENGEFLFELAMKNIRTIYENEIKVQMGKDGYPSMKVHRYETTYFTFGNFDWNLVIYPRGDNEENEGFMMVYLNRLTHFEHHCKVAYKLIIGSGIHKVKTNLLEQTLDISGSGEGYRVDSEFQDLIHRGRMKIDIEMISATTVSEVQVFPSDRAHSSAHCYDRDKQAWCIEASFDEDYLKLRLYYSDISNVPRNYLRYVCWSVHIIPAKPDLVRMTTALNSPFSKYYSQCEHDDGIEMQTNIPVREITRGRSPYLDEDDHHLTIQIEWIESHLLYHANYHRYDDVNRGHTYQMRQEIAALQAENYTLEKQLHSYQQSIAVAHAKGQFTEDHSPLVDGY